MSERQIREEELDFADYALNLGKQVEQTFGIKGATVIHPEHLSAIGQVAYAPNEITILTPQCRQSVKRVVRVTILQDWQSLA